MQDTIVMTAGHQNEQRGPPENVICLFSQTTAQKEENPEKPQTSVNKYNTAKHIMYHDSYFSYYCRRKLLTLILITYLLAHTAAKTSVLSSAKEQYD